MMLLLLACHVDNQAKGNDGDADTDTDSDPDSDSGSDSETDADILPFPPDTTGFTATSVITGVSDGSANPDWWCSINLTITGTRQDDRCSRCDYGFTLAAVPTYAPGSAPDCAAPVVATMMADAERTDPFLGYYADERNGGVYPMWYIKYTDGYTVMDVEGQLTSHTSGITRRTLSWLGPFDTTTEGFAWAADLGFEGWRPEQAPTLWAACSDWPETVDSTDWDGEAGVVEEDVWECSSYCWEGDRWLLPLIAGDTANLAWDDYAGEFGMDSEPLHMFVVRPDGCAGQHTLVDSGYYGATSFVANVTGDWYVVIAPSSRFTGKTQYYELYTQVNGLAVTPTLVDDDAHMYYMHDGDAEVEGTWVR